MDSKNKQIDKIFSSEGYIFPNGKKVNSTMRLTIDERLYIALGRIHNKKSGKDGITRKKLAQLFGVDGSSITKAAKGDKNLSIPLNVFRYIFEKVGLPYRDIGAPDPDHYYRDLPPALRNYKDENNI